MSGPQPAPRRRRLGHARVVNSALVARLVGACFGLVFVLVNTSAVPTPWSWVLRALGLAGAVVVLLRLRSPTRASVLEPRTSAIRVYWTSVLVEAVALVAGTRLLAASGHGQYGVAWVAFVVGVHFLPFAWAFRLPAFLPLGVALMILAAAGAALGLLGAGEAWVAAVAGVGAGLALLVFAAAPTGAGGR